VDRLARSGAEPALEAAERTGIVDFRDAKIHLDVVRDVGLEDEVDHAFGILDDPGRFAAIGPGDLNGGEGLDRPVDPEAIFVPTDLIPHLVVGEVKAYPAPRSVDPETCNPVVVETVGIESLVVVQDAGGPGRVEIVLAFGQGYPARAGHEDLGRVHGAVEAQGKADGERRAGSFGEVEAEVQFEGIPDAFPRS